MKHLKLLKIKKNSYPNGDMVYNNTSLYLADVSMEDASNLKGDSETKRLQFFNPDEKPENLMDVDLIKSYLKYNCKYVKISFIKIENGNI